MDSFPDELFFWNNLAEAIANLYPEYVAANFVTLKFISEISSKSLRIAQIKLDEFKRAIGNGGIDFKNSLKLPRHTDHPNGKKLITLENRNLDAFLTKILNLVEDTSNNTSLSTICEFKYPVDAEPTEKMTQEPTLAVSLQSRQPSIEDLHASSVRFSSRRKGTNSQPNTQLLNEPVDLNHFRELLETYFNSSINFGEFETTFSNQITKTFNSNQFDAENLIEMSIDGGKTVLDLIILSIEEIVYKWQAFKNPKICEPAFGLLSMNFEKVNDNRDPDWVFNRFLALSYFTIHLSREDYYLHVEKFIAEFESFVQFNDLSLDMFANFRVYYHHLISLISSDNDEKAYSHLLECKQALADNNLAYIDLPFYFELSNDWIENELTKISKKTKINEMQSSSHDITWYKIHLFGNNECLEPATALQSIPHCYWQLVIRSFSSVNLLSSSNRLDFFLGSTGK